MPGGMIRKPELLERLGYQSAVFRKTREDFQMQTAHERAP